jgi:hypothetical protein
MAQMRSAFDNLVTLFTIFRKVIYPDLIYGSTAKTPFCCIRVA